MDVETKKKKTFKKRDKGYWLNTKYIKEPKATKPCHKCGFCPYGQLVEEFGFSGPVPTAKNNYAKGKYSCHVFGHDCPVFYHAEPWNEKDWAETKVKL
jgi:hypothetical protein